MQTFLPFPDFKQSADALDMRRLGKQRIEVLQILYALEDGSTSKWRNHPATRMWRGYAYALAAYGIEVCEAWRAMGYEDNTLLKIVATCEDQSIILTQEWLDQNDLLPPWLGNEAFHRSHRSNLIRKNAKYYRGYLGWTDPDDLPYLWPE